MAPQALVVALDAAVHAGQDGRMLTQSLIFDALAEPWSQTYRAIRKAGPARHSREMTPKTLRATWSELVLAGIAGIRFKKIWNVIRSGMPGLYETERIQERGYIVKVDEESPVLGQFVAILEANPGYSRRSTRQRLLLADDPEPPRAGPRREVACEVGFTNQSLV